MIKKIAVLGAGAGGRSAAVEMTLKGYTVNLFEFPRFREFIEPIMMQDGEIAKIGDVVMFAKVNKATTNIEEAVKGVDTIIIAMRCMVHRAIAELCAPHLEDGQTVCYIGEPGGALEFAKVMKERGIEKHIVLGETNTLPYVGRAMKSNAAETITKKGGTKAAAFPARDNPKLMKVVNELWPSVMPATNVFEVILLDYNAIDESEPLILNAGRVEGTRGVMLYGEAVTPSVARVIEAVNNETLAIRKAMGFKDKRVWPKDWLVEQGLLDSAKPTTYESIQSSEIAKWIINCGPNMLRESMYAIESLPYGLRLISSVGELVGVNTPVIDALITLLSVMNEVDYWKEGRTAEKLGIPKGLSVEELNRFLYEGKI